MPLGHQLRADDDVGLALGDGVELQPQPLTPPRMSDDSTIVRASGNCVADLLGDPLDAGTAGDEMIERAAFRAGLRPPLVVAAMMADELPAEAVLDQPAEQSRHWKRWPQTRQSVSGA